MTQFGIIGRFFKIERTLSLIIIGVMRRFHELEIASDEFSIENLIEQITHVLSVTLPLIKNVLLQ